MLGCLCAVGVAWSQPQDSKTVESTAAGHMTKVAANPLRFRKHLLSSESEFSAAGVLDVNSDGKVDIVCGAWWYEAPHWQKHYFREIEKIRGRFDDYSNLVVDVDGDGAADIISVNFRSQSLFWSRNPGNLSNDVTERLDPLPADPQSSRLEVSKGETSKDENPWKNFIIDRPGTSETGRLVDLNGDGQLDVLPAGTNFAAWYEFFRPTDPNSTDPNSTDQVRWVKHSLPDELIGHGIGVGDINGDGRIDVVGPRGWAEAPRMPAEDRWIWHPEFELARDCALPILTWDVDGDGDLDLVWARGHNIGLYWTEQITADQLSVGLPGDLLNHPVVDTISRRKWVTHAIDTSWANIHTLMTADLDGDGTLELVAGKRFMGHDGKDPGEYDPLAIYSYQYDVQHRTWQRRTISYGGRCGIDLDSVCADLDGDGDIDIVAPSRAGLYWLENLSEDLSQPATADRESRLSDTDVDAKEGKILGQYRDHLDLSFVVDEQLNRRQMETPFDHGLRRAHALQQMQLVMGPFPAPEFRIPLDIQVQSIEDAQGYWRIHLTFATDDAAGKVDRVPAYLLIPYQLDATGSSAENQPSDQAKSALLARPAMLCLHQTQFEFGKGEPCALGGNTNLHYAHELALRGFVCLAPDYPGFAEYEYDFQKTKQHYASGTMKAIWNHVRALDLLETLPCVRRDSIGVIGHSLGGHNALFVAAFDQRIRGVVTSCGFNSFQDYYGGNLKGWTSDRYMPRISQLFNNDPSLVPFDFPQVLASIAPRPIFVNAALHDANFAVIGVQKCEQAIKPIYQTIYGVQQHMRFEYPDAQHDFPKQIRDQAYDWIEAMLKQKK